MQGANFAGIAREPFYVLDAIDRAGRPPNFVTLREKTGLNHQTLQSALKFCNGRGWVAGRPATEGSRTPIFYSLTQLGDDFLQAFRTGQIVELRRMAARVGADRVPAYRAAYPFLFKHD